MDNYDRLRDSLREFCSINRHEVHRNLGSFHMKEWCFGFGCPFHDPPFSISFGPKILRMKQTLPSHTTQITRDQTPQFRLQ
jgi:hypothetical protein